MRKPQNRTKTELNCIAVSIIEYLFKTFILKSPSQMFTEHDLKDLVNRIDVELRRRNEELRHYDQ